MTPNAPDLREVAAAREIRKADIVFLRTVAHNYFSTLEGEIGERLLRIADRLEESGP